MFAVITSPSAADKRHITLVMIEVYCYNKWQEMKKVRI